MNLIQAMKRLSYTTANGHKCNDKDVDALNVVIDWVNAEKQESINQNRYFGKLVISYYIELLQHYNWDNYMTEKVIQEMLDKSLEEYYVRFKNIMNTKAYLDTADIIGLDLNHVHEGKTHEEKKAIAENNKKLMRENKDDLIKSVNPWTEKEINSKLNHFISELLNKYGNMP